MVEPEWGIFAFWRGSVCIKMKVLKIVTAVFAFGAILLAGCSSKDNGVTKITFNRGHGSMWGNQFYIELQATEIVQARYIPEGQSELVTLEHIPITDAQWQTLKSTVEQLPLEKTRTDIWEKQKLDGSEFRELTLVRGKKEVTYYWPNTPEAQQLEQLFETLLADSIAPTPFFTGEFSVEVPAGWKAFQVEDVFSDTPGTYKTDRINIIRGGTQESDIHSKIYIMVECYGPDKAMVEPDPKGLQDACEITPFQTGEHWWYGFTGTDMQGRVRLGTSAVLWSQGGKQQYIVAFPLEFNNQTLSLDDPALLAILESLSPYGSR